jgi:hypothetical protein
MCEFATETQVVSAHRPPSRLVAQLLPTRRQPRLLRRKHFPSFLERGDDPGREVRGSRKLVWGAPRIIPANCR